MVISAIKPPSTRSRSNLKARKTVSPGRRRYDAAAGIATGYALRNAQGLPAGAQQAIHEAVIDMPGLSLIFGLSIVGTGAWVVALIAAAMALRRAGAPRGPFVLLILAGVFLMGGHPFPAGTLAFGCFFLATAWLELAPRAIAHAQANTIEQEGTP